MRSGLITIAFAICNCQLGAERFIVKPDGETDAGFEVSNIKTL